MLTMVCATMTNTSAEPPNPAQQEPLPRVETVQYLDKEDAMKFLSTLVAEFVTFMEKYEVDDFSMFAIDTKDMNEIKNLKHTATELVKSALLTMSGAVECSDALKSAFLSQILSISQTYSAYKQTLVLPSTSLASTRHMWIFYPISRNCL